ncbi:MAG: hypothetical protein WCB49_04245 [Gammaproteobacteria bacterium]
MNIRLAVLLLLPAMAFATQAQAHGDDNQDQHWNGEQIGYAPVSSPYGLRDQVIYLDNGPDQRPPSRRKEPPLRQPGKSAVPTNVSRSQDRYRPPPSWHGDRRVWNNQVYWRADIRLFPRYDWTLWRSGYWHHGWYNGLWAWWWIAGGVWFYYPAPIYPYPNPYVPGTVTVVNTEPTPPAAPAQAPAAQYWYHCKAPEGYYPYVAQCPDGWTKVPATPAPAPSQPVAAPPSTTH